ANLGHTMEAAGIAGFIKAVLALKEKKIPPLLHFTTPNPHFDLENSSFFIPSTLREWKSQPFPRRAGVSSFGFGGTNAHVLLEEAPESIASPISTPQLLVLSAKTPTALKTLATNLAHHLQQNPELSLADVTYTLQVGRREFDIRKAFICRD